MESQSHLGPIGAEHAAVPCRRGASARRGVAAGSALAAFRINSPGVTKKPTEGTSLVGAFPLLINV
jgi:hypothetical protein